MAAQSFTDPEESRPAAAFGVRVLLTGKLTGLNRREVQSLIRERGGTVAETLDPSVDWLVLGDGVLPLADSDIAAVLEHARRLADGTGRPAIMTESEFWRRLGFVDEELGVRKLYTPAMLAELLQVPVAVIRRWHRRGLIRPAHEVHRLPYFDFEEITTARRLAELLAAGVSPQSIERQLEELRRVLPQVERPLAQLPVLVEGKALLLRHGDGLIEPGGQRRFDFDAGEAPPAVAEPWTAAALRQQQLSATQPIDAAEVLQLVTWAGQLEDEGRLLEAAEMLRAALAAGPVTAELCFRLAELLYSLDDITAARERYFMAVELDGEYVEARANLGCVLAELGDRELAVAAFQGALAIHPDYADVHYQLARTLEELKRVDEALVHWQRFLALAPSSPWATEARDRVEASTTSD